MNASNIVNTDDDCDPWTTQEWRLQATSLVGIISALAGIGLFIKVAVINIEFPDSAKDMCMEEWDKAAAAVQNESVILFLAALVCALIALLLGIYARRTVMGKAAIFLALSPALLCFAVVLFIVLSR